MADWPQWRGPRRDGISAEKLTWAGGAPRQLWKAILGQGFSAVAVQGGRLYTLGNARNEDWVHCLDASTGKVIWQYRYPCAPGDYGGPRATPSVTNGKVYTLSREGLALCLDASGGKVLWKRELGRETKAQIPQWGFSGSPLVAGSRVFYNVGAAGAALDAATGRVLWASGGGPAGYASPVAFSLPGQSGIALFAGSGLVGLDPASGRSLWRYPWQTSYDVNAADPIFVRDTVFLSSNYGKGGALLRIAGGRLTPVWESRAMKNHFNTCVLAGGYLYGNDENTLRCLELSTGRERWSLRGIDKGGLIAADGKLIVLTGRGELVLLAANPGKLTELARAPVLSGTCWTHPVLAGGRLYCRSQEGTLVCLDLRK